MSEGPLYSDCTRVCAKCLSQLGRERDSFTTTTPATNHPGGNPGANLKSISHRSSGKYHFEWELTKETIYLPLGCLQGGAQFEAVSQHAAGVLRLREWGWDYMAKHACTEAWAKTHMTGGHLSSRHRREFEDETGVRGGYGLSKP